MVETNNLASKEVGQVIAPETTRGGNCYTPRVDIFESTDEVVLQCDIPGVKPQDVDVRFEEGELTLMGKVAPRQNAVDFVDQEYGLGDFYRSFTVAPEIDAGKIAAECRDGVLTVHLPKQERVKPRRITVQAG